MLEKLQSAPTDPLPLPARLHAPGAPGGQVVARCQRQRAQRHVCVAAAAHDLVGRVGAHGVQHLGAVVHVLRVVVVG